MELRRVQIRINRLMRLIALQSMREERARQDWIVVRNNLRVLHQKKQEMQDYLNTYKKILSKEGQLSVVRVSYVRQVRVFSQGLEQVLQAHETHIARCAQHVQTAQAHYERAAKKRMLYEKVHEKWTKNCNHLTNKQEQKVQDAAGMLPQRLSFSVE